MDYSAQTYVIQFIKLNTVFRSHKNIFPRALMPLRSVRNEKLSCGIEIGFNLMFKSLFNWLISSLH